jgi:hypothetical protein
MKLPSGRRAFVERMSAMITPPAAPVPVAPIERSLRDQLVEAHGDGLLLVETRRSADESEVVLVVLEDADAAMVEQQRLAAADEPRLEVIDRRSYEMIRRLAGVGVLPSLGQGQELFRSDRLVAPEAEQRRQRLARSAEVLGSAERKLRMALLLAEGGFAAEAMPALDECLALAASARSLIAGDAETERAVAAEPPAPQSLTDVVGAIGALLGDIRRGLRPAAAAA